MTKFRKTLGKTLFRILPAQLLLTLCVICAISGLSFAQTATFYVPNSTQQVATVPFGPEAVSGTSGAQTITLTNTGSATLSSIVLSVYTTATGTTSSSDFAQATTPVTNCGGSLTAGSSCTISLTFTPTAVGVRSAWLSVADNASNSPQTIALTGTGFSPLSLTSTNLGALQGASSTSITGTSFVPLGLPITLPANVANYANKRIHVHGSGRFTNAATSPLIEIEVSACTVSGCGSGTVVSPLVFISTADGQTLTNAQFTFDGYLVLNTVDSGSGGTFWGHGFEGVNLGSATTVALSWFADVSSAVSSAITLTSVEYLEPQFKFSVSNASNTAILDEWGAELLN